ncbi:hypothetical protein V8C35DRAFT_302931, partial [Trichoderma chlorosporum]
MEIAGRRSNFERGLARYPNGHQSARGASAAFVFAPSHYLKLDEAANWIEFDSKIRSVKYHLGKYIDHRDRNKDTEGSPPKYNQMATEATSPQENDSLVHCVDGSIPSGGWRLKVESDMAISGLLALKNILDLLYENGKPVIDIAGSLTIWSFLMSASYVVRSLHYNRYLDNGAFVTLCAAGYCTLSSTCQLIHTGMRLLAINRCQNIVTLLYNRILAGTISHHDVRWLHHYWFRALSWYRVEDKSEGRLYGTPYGSFVNRSLPSSEYVIPVD